MGDIEMLFYSPLMESSSEEIDLSDDESYHALKVLRLKIGDTISVTNGLGLISEGRIIGSKKNNITLKLEKHNFIDSPKIKIHLAISPIKKRSKIEWMIEKVTELGVSEISIVNCQRSERSIMNVDRLEKIMISAIKQSLNPYKPIINSGISFGDFIKKHSDYSGQKFIAHCKTSLSEHLSGFYKQGKNVVLLIGPEGDFTEDEVRKSMESGFIPVSLGNRRLRSETAAIYSVISIDSLNMKW